jgi:hypothetical protein
VRGAMETSDWPIHRHVEPPHCRKHCRLALILRGQSLPTLPHGGRARHCQHFQTLPLATLLLGQSPLPLGQSDVSIAPRTSDHPHTHVKHESLFRPRSTVYYSRKCLKPIFDHVPGFAANLGFLPDFATDFDFLTLGFWRARPPTCAASLGRRPSEGCECTKFWWRHDLRTLQRCAKFGGLTPLAR